MWRGEVPHILSNLESGDVLVSIGLLVPLSGGVTLKNVVILCVGYGLMGGWRICARNLRASCIYRAKHLWSGSWKSQRGSENLWTSNETFLWSRSRQGIQKWSAPRSPLLVNDIPSRFCLVYQSGCPSLFEVCENLLCTGLEECEEHASSGEMYTMVEQWACLSTPRSAQCRRLSLGATLL